MHKFFMALFGALIGILLFAVLGYFSDVSYEADSYGIVVLIGAIGGALTAIVIDVATEHE